MNNKKTALVVGTGSGGGMIAKELQGRYQVTILEAGGEFKPFSMPIGKLAALRRTGLFFDERMIRLLLPNMRVEKTEDMVMVRGIGVGGTTTLATGNAVRCDGAVWALGIDLDEQFAELSRELPITTDHQQHWTETTWTMFRLFEQMGLDSVVTPKLMRAARCAECGHCAIGCPTGAKWDTRALTKEAVQKGAVLITDCRVTDLDIENGEVKAVHAQRHGKRETYRADLVVLSAGGLGTPVIFQHSGVPCSDTLFADPVLCVAGPMEDFGQDHQLLMPFISQQDGYILSPYMDYLSFFFHRSWWLHMRNIASIMIKLADEETGTTDGKHINKTMSSADQRHMDRTVAQSREILERLGVRERDQFLGTLNAGHPGGMLPLTEGEKENLHPSILPENLYVADATILPRSMGNPPMLTIMALAKKIASLL